MQYSAEEACRLFLNDEDDRDISDMATIDSNHDSEEEYSVSRRYVH